ncbi:MAG: hypothetical protein KatS3mg035_2156 [Bacteroidia bacterium]|nr:MAG: hypothetical protein KatS3mg035_2156 [Bacteroidia bacterium]
MNIFRYLIISTLIFSCKTSDMLSVVQSNNVDIIVITHINTKEKHILTDKDQIKKVLSDYLETAKRKPVKFIASYQVILVRDQKEEKYLITNRYVNYGGNTYEMKNDFSEFVTRLKASH